MEILGKYGSFISGMVGAIVVFAGGLIGLRVRQAGLVTSVNGLMTSVDELKKQIDKINDLRRTDKREVLMHTDAMTRHFHRDIQVLREELKDRSTQHDKLMNQRMDDLQNQLRWISGSLKTMRGSNKKMRR